MSMLDTMAAALLDEGRSRAEVYGYLLGQFVGTPYVGTQLVEDFLGQEAFHNGRTKGGMFGRENRGRILLGQVRKSSPRGGPHGSRPVPERIEHRNGQEGTAENLE